MQPLALGKGAYPRYTAKEFLSHFELLHLTGFSPLHSLRHVTGELAARNGKWEDKAKVSWRSSVHRALILCPGNGILALNPFGLASAEDLSYLSK